MKEVSEHQKVTAKDTAIITAMAQSLSDERKNEILQKVQEIVEKKKNI